jgi:hypothetical protein
MICGDVISRWWRVKREAGGCDGDVDVPHTKYVSFGEVWLEGGEIMTVRIADGGL